MTIMTVEEIKEKYKLLPRPRMVSYTTVRHRVRKLGLSFEEAIKRPYHGVSVSIDKAKLVFNRMQSGQMDLREFIDFLGDSGTTVCFGPGEDIDRDLYYQLERNPKVSFEDFCERMESGLWKPHNAISVPVDKRPKRDKDSNMSLYYRNHPKPAVSYVMFMKRVKQGMTREQAITMVPSLTGKKPKTKVGQLYLDGKPVSYRTYYESIKEPSVAFQTFSKRLVKGMSIEEALFGVPPRRRELGKKEYRKIEHEGKKLTAREYYSLFPNPAVDYRTFSIRYYKAVDPYLAITTPLFMTKSRKQKVT